MEKEPPWSTALMTSVRVAFGLLLLTLTLIAFSQILLSILGRIADEGERNAWIGFWGSLVGGAIGLVGGLIAAVAAVYAVRQQLSEQRRSEAQASLNATKGYKAVLFNVAGIQVECLRAIFTALSNGDFHLAIANLMTVCEAFPHMSDELLAVVAQKNPTAAPLMGIVQRQITRAVDAARSTNSWSTKASEPTKNLSNPLAARHAKSLGWNTRILITSFKMLGSALSDESASESAFFQWYYAELDKILAESEPVLSSITKLADGDK